MKILGVEINKKLAVIATGIVGVCFGYAVVSMFFAPAEKPVKNNNPTAALQAQQQTKPKANTTAKQDKKQEQTEKTDQEAVHVTSPSLEELLRVNPFVELHMTASAAENTGESTIASNMPLPAIPGRSRENQIMAETKAAAPSASSSRSVPLPAIPRNGNVPSPSVRMPSSSAAGGSNPTVQGVLTGDDGSNIAILSDGRVVEAGDKIGNDSISYIGGDGIQLNNGHSLDYK